MFYSTKSKINDYFNQIFGQKLEIVLLTQKFRTLGLGVMVDSYNEYVGGLDPRTEELRLAEKLERNILKINPVNRKRSMMQMMVFEP